MALQVQFCSSIDALEAVQWNRLHGAGHPFLRHEFLSALESNSCVGEASGWIPHHLAIMDDKGILQAAAPLYLKNHSWGEFVFDWSWADAYQQYGLPYYPKLVCAVPFTPVTGSRLLVLDDPALRGELIRAALAEARSLQVSSAHFLFTTCDEQAQLEHAGFKSRNDCRFIWRNQDYKSFADFLSQLTASRRKKIKRERRRIREAGISFQWLSGDEIDPGLWRTVCALCHQTFSDRGHEPYITLDCFIDLGNRIPECMKIVVARNEDGVCAAAVFFHDADSLYGRYWGAREFVDSLHFETCYYQGIEFCIANGLSSFDPGTHGEHKLIRGFAPTRTWSWHWFSDARFADAIQRYLDQEQAQIDHYISMASSCLPFRRDSHARQEKSP